MVVALLAALLIGARPVPAQEVGAPVAWPGSTPATGGLQASGSLPGAAGDSWATLTGTPPAAGLYQLSLAVQATAGSPRLLLAVAATGAAPGAAWWTWTLTDLRAHRADLILSLPAAAQLCVGVAGGTGAVQVTDLRLLPLAKGPAFTDPWLALAPPAVAAEALPADWQPTGTLDAQVREVGQGRELIVSLRGLTVTLPAEVEATAGERHPVLLYADNKGEVDKTLTVALRLPAGGAMPSYSIPVRPRGTTAILAPCPAIRAGAQWAQFVFTVDTETKSAPVLLKVAPGYPALALPGAASDGWPAGLTWGEGLAGPAPRLARVPLSEASAAAQAPAWPALLQFVPTTQDSPAALAAAYRGVAAAQAQRGGEMALVTPTWDLQVTPQGLQPPEAMQAAFAAGLKASAQSVGLGVASLPALGVLTEKLDGKLTDRQTAFWSAFSHAYGLSPLREWLIQQNALRPKLLDLTSLAPAGEPRLELLTLARLVVEECWQGATGLVLDPRPGGLLLTTAEGQPRVAVAEGLRELWRELAGATPLLVPSDEGGLCGTSVDSPVRVWSFLRGQEGLVVLANNTALSQEILVEPRVNPTQLQVLRLSAWGAPVVRQMQGVFRFTEEARTRHQAAIYTRLAPGEMVALSLWLDVPADPSWLRSVTRMIPREVLSPASPPPASGDQPWMERGKPF
jgi:hypothetical protein